MVVPPTILNGLLVVPFLDRVRVWTDRALTHDELSYLKANSKRVRVTMKPMRFHPEWRCSLEMLRPTPRTLRAVESLMNGRKYTINHAEVTLDFVYDRKKSVRRLRRYLDRRLVMPARKGHHGVMPVYYPGKRGPTLYFARRPSAQNLVMYNDRRSKKAKRPCVHIEWRVNGGDAMARLGVTTISDVREFDHHTFWKKHLSLYRLRESHRRDLGHLFLTNMSAANHELGAKRMGAMILRAAAVTHDGATAGELVAWARRCVNFCPQKVMEMIEVTPLLPATAEKNKQDRRMKRRQMKAERAGRTTVMRNPDAKPLRVAAGFWEAVKGYIPMRRNTHRFGGGRPRKNDRAVMEAIFTAALGVCGWNELREKAGCAGTTANDRLQEWRGAGVFAAMYRDLRDREELAGVDWTVLLGEGGYSDSQTPGSYDTYPTTTGAVSGTQPAKKQTSKINTTTGPTRGREVPSV